MADDNGISVFGDDNYKGDDYYPLLKKIVEIKYPDLDSKLEKLKKIKSILDES